jgi:tRNA (guanine-N7-)-methyltransferase
MTHTPRHKHADDSDLRTFGRTRGKTLSPYQQRLMAELYPQIKIGDTPLAGLEGYKDVWFEIGFGGAEHLVWQAQENRDIAVLGAEPFLNGVAKAVRGASEHGLTNLRVLQGDARDVLAALPDESLSRLFILFPDPWPKARHNKRRIINEALLVQIYRVLKPGSEFRFASDIIHYVDWTLWRVKAHRSKDGGGFDMPHQKNSDWRTRPDDWPETRYEAKAIREGRPCHYFRFIRR